MNKQELIEYIESCINKWECPNLRYTDLRNADLRGAGMYGADLSGARTAIAASGIWLLCIGIRMREFLTIAVYLWPWAFVSVIKR